MTTNIPCYSCGYDPTTEVSFTQDLVVEFAWKSGNIIQSNTKRGGWKYRKYRDDFEKALGLVVWPVKPVEPKGFRRVTLTRVYAGRKYPYDDDNLRSGAKPLRDILTQYDLIHDDSPEYAEFIYKQRAGDVDQVLITLEDIREEEERTT